MMWKSITLLSALVASSILAVGARAEEAPDPTAGDGQAPPAEAAGPTPLSADELEQLVAPVALYADPLLAQLLPATTDPANIAKAAVYARVTSRGVVGTDWSPAVTALAQFHPDVIVMLADHKDWTALLAAAVTGQQADVLHAIQQVRTRAQAAGNLVSDEHQVVVVSDGLIRIEPTPDGEIYPPTYDPAAVVLPAPPGGGVVSYGAPVRYESAPAYAVDWGDTAIYTVGGGGYGNVTTITNANAYSWMTAYRGYGQRGYTRWQSPQLRQAAYSARNSGGGGGIGPSARTMANVYGPAAGVGSAMGMGGQGGIGPSAQTMANVYGPGAGVRSAYSMSSGTHQSAGIGPGAWSSAGLSNRPGARSSGSLPRSSASRRSRAGSHRAPSTARSSGLASSSRGQSARVSSHRGSSSRSRGSSAQRGSSRSSSAFSGSSRSRSGSARASSARGSRSRSSSASRSRGGGGRSSGGGGRSGGGRR